MIKRFIVIIGLSIAFYAVTTTRVSATPLYEQLYTQMEYELYPNENTEDAISDHIRIIVPPEKDIPAIINSIAWLRGTMRTLQLAASAEEASIGLYENTNDTGVFLLRLQSLIKIWEGDAEVAPIPLGEFPIEFNEYKNIDLIPFNNLKTELQTLKDEDTEQFEAAVFRYRNGFKSIQEECENTAKGNGTELQFINARFCAVEEKLDAIMQSIQIDLGSVQPNKTILFPIYSLKDLNVNVWVRNDDVGITWINQLSTILPSMDCSMNKSYSQEPDECITNENNENGMQGAILGGKYPSEPPEPQELEGYCSHPIARRGYLCRPQEKANCPKENILDSEQTGGEIILSKCTSPLLETPLRITLSSMNICGEDGWLIPSNETINDTENRDDHLSATPYQNCYVDMVCDDCQEGTSYKEENGRIEICMDTEYEPLSEYFAIREFVHARQQCNTAPNDDWVDTYETRNGCCAMEIQANMTACNAMAEDGILSKTNISTTSCAVALSNIRCEEVIGSGGLPANAPAGSGVCGDNGTAESGEQILTKLKTYVQTNSGSLQSAKTCSEVISSPGEKIEMLRESLSQVCSPGYEAQYKNTIGNTLCNIGQCIEQSLEEQKIMPGRVPFSVQDEAYPWESQREPRPEQEKHTLQAFNSSYIPAYQPLALIRKMEDALCQAKGMPRRSVPALCSFDVQRRLTLPSKTHGIFAEDTETQIKAANDSHARLLSLMPGIGARTGSDLFRQYFEPTMLSLDKILQGINAMLTTLENTEFPLDMCPRINE